jgi:hypothetical protein
MFDLNLPPKNNNIEIKTDKVMHVKNVTNFSYYTGLGKTQMGARRGQPEYFVTAVLFVCYRQQQMLILVFFPFQH